MRSRKLGPALSPRKRSARTGVTAAWRRGTRAQLLETAGQVFAEKGFSGATSQEICRRCRANTAAVVYHFGGIVDLYRDVLHEAHRRVAPAAVLAETVGRAAHPKAKLAAFIRLLVGGLSGPLSRSWAMRVMIREILAPGPIADEIRNEDMRACTTVLQSIVTELTGVPVDHPAVARSCINIMAPLGILFVLGAQPAERAFPVLQLSPDTMEENTRHMLQFALGGLEAIAQAESGRRHTAGIERSK